MHLRNSEASGTGQGLDSGRSASPRKRRLKGRNFENGQKMFAATRCIICHRFGGDGGATGPI